MNKYYRHTELLFEKLTSIATILLGNSITFMIAIAVVIFWLSNKIFHSQSIDDTIRDFILCVTFLSLFIIQKSFNRFSTLLHLKVNELVSSNKDANNAVMNLELKSEKELLALNKEYEQLVMDED